ncbi:Alpha/Beta hydrolase protein [Gymnopilus junonius]|uniref:Alpha/Beta hydrolase protein n=1 Tax=Gymnopilus junonius TaxID=109634 RepID=A0A9P5TPR2_GYMJU|nr:Alpha/Beta hydrolase protein [Gymnopilus junonius]
MGLNSSSFSWGPQVRWFGLKGGESGKGTCTALVFDNRGVGNSGYPRGPYTTSGMAEDVICLLDYLGWTEKRQLNVVGISLGGMIAQELAYRIPHRISSLLLAVTTPGGHIWNNFLRCLKGLQCLTKLTFTPAPENKVPTVLDMLFPKVWLDEKAKSDPHAEWNGNTEDNKQGKTNSDVQAEGFLRRVTITKPQLFMGHISQMAAALTHYVSPERLAYIAANAMKNGLSKSDAESNSRRVELQQWEETGHGIHAQREDQFNLLVERCVREGKALLESGFEGRDV